VYGEQGKNADSLRILRQAITLAPNSAIAWRYIGYIYHYAGLTDLAEAAWRHGRDLDPSPAQAYWMHARMLLYQGKTTEAEEEVRRALDRYPDQFKLLTVLAYVLYYEGKMDDAARLESLRTFFLAYYLFGTGPAARKCVEVSGEAAMV
jgi:tetratricopeptide (TPR) repeat protein